LVSLPATAFGLVWAVFFDLQVWALFLPIIAIGFAHGFSQPNLISGAVSVNPRLAGSASGLLGFIQMASGAFATFVLGHVQDGTSLPLASLMFGCALLSLAAHIFAVRARLDVAKSTKGN
jgi:DHA1 family bicyclomycin/chloramphenicol resistance-like MFS transporter